MAQNRFGGNFKLVWSIFDGLKATAQYAVFDDNYRGSYYAYGQVGNTMNYISTDRSTTETRTETLKDSFTAYLSYDKEFGKHNISATDPGFRSQLHGLQPGHQASAHLVLRTCQLQLRQQVHSLGHGQD